MKAKTIRRIIGITALMLWGTWFAVRPRLNKWWDTLFWQLDKYVFIFATLLAVIYLVWLIIHLVYGKHWGWKTAGGLCCLAIALVGFEFVCVQASFINKRLWGDGQYIVYLEQSHGFFDDRDIVIYERHGFVEKRKVILNTVFEGDVRLKSEYTVYDPYDLLKEEADVRYYGEGKDISHYTAFYKLSTGQLYYGENTIDSIQRLINKQ
ncbi:MAG: hypothetical protein IJ760_08345 [Bacteroidales bacterium]|nr:hypothetical protein [Bacteroidales bacterium]